MRDEPNRGEIYLSELEGSNDWHIICMQYRLSEEFMEEFENCLDWDTVTVQQKMSARFIRKYLHKLNLSYLSFYQRGMPMDLKMEVDRLISQRQMANFRKQMERSNE